MQTRPALAIFLLLATVAASAQPAVQSFPAIYVAGHAGTKGPWSGGVLLIDRTELRITKWTKFDQPTKDAFVIPLAAVVDATASTERETYFGAFSANAVRNQDYVTITTETADAAEAIVLKVEKKQAAGIVAKILFAKKQFESQHIADKSGAF